MSCLHGHDQLISTVLTAICFFDYYILMACSMRAYFNGPTTPKSPVQAISIRRQQEHCVRGFPEVYPASPHFGPSACHDFRQRHTPLARSLRGHPSPVRCHGVVESRMNHLRAIMIIVSTIVYQRLAELGRSDQPTGTSYQLV